MSGGLKAITLHCILLGTNGDIRLRGTWIELVWTHILVDHAASNVDSNQHPRRR